VCGEVPEPTSEGLAALLRTYKKSMRKLPKLQPWTRQQVVDSFKGKRRVIYQAAADSLAKKPITRADAVLSCFVKSEKFNPEDKINPDPRMISARGPRYNLELGTYMRPLEHVVYLTKGPSGLRKISKGMTPRKKALLLEKKRARFQNPVVIDLDAARWDKHVNAQVKAMQRKFEAAPYSNDPYLVWLLEMQHLNNCYTAGGVSYAIEGKVMSGEITTAEGNCNMAVNMCDTSMELLGVTEYEIMDDGDDILLILDERDLQRVLDGIEEVYLGFGQTIKIGGVARTMEEVNFCQSKPICKAGKFTFVRNWRKVLSQTTSGVEHWHDPSLVRPMFGIIGACELAANAGVPILQSYGAALLRLSRGQFANVENLDSSIALRAKIQFGDDWATKITKTKSKPVLQSTRISFESAFGITPDEQAHIESCLDGWEIDDVVCQHMEYPELDYTWVNNTPL